jgi:hypothetical protein
MKRHRKGRALKRRYGRQWGRPMRHGHSRTRRPSRAEMIAALGLEAETRHRGMTGVAIGRYAATTAEFWHRIRHGSSQMDVEARRRLGVEKAR